MTDKDKRKNTRVVFQTTATVRFAGEVFEHLVIRDLSLRGVYLEGLTERILGEKCEVEIFLTGSSGELKLNIAGKVVRQDDHGAGVHFEEIELDTFTHLKNIVSYNADKSDQVEDELVGNIFERTIVE